jgi:hypothetical protein
VTAVYCCLAHADCRTRIARQSNGLGMPFRPFSAPPAAEASTGNHWARYRVADTDKCRGREASHALPRTGKPLRQLETRKKGSENAEGRPFVLAEDGAAGGAYQLA